MGASPKTISRDGNSEASTSSSPSPAPSSAQPQPKPLPFTISKKFHSMTAGAGAGLVSSIVTCPLDVVKTRLQAQHLSRDSAEYEGVRKTVSRIWRQAGFRGFYRGLGPTLGGYLPTWGIYFTVYDLVKDRLGEFARRSGESGGCCWDVQLIGSFSSSRGGDGSVPCTSGYDSWSDGDGSHESIMGGQDAVHGECIALRMLCTPQNTFGNHPARAPL
jgi:hypothetical protein